MLNRTEGSSFASSNAKPEISAQPPATIQKTPPRQNMPEQEGILGDLQRSTCPTTDSAAHKDGFKSSQAHQPRPVRTNIDSTPEALAALFDRFASQTPSKPIAVISGGSLSGCSTALELANQGYEVVLAEKRDHFTRQNVLSLKTDTLLYWASLSPDGSLLRNMVQNDLTTPCTRDVIRAADSTSGFATVPNPSIRFLNWLLPATPLPPQIPVRERRADLQVLQQDLEGLADNLPRPRNSPLVEALDTAWPANEPLGMVSPTQWRGAPAQFFGSDNLVFGQLCNIENALNEYCIQQPSIHVVKATIELQDDLKKQGDYRPAFIFERPGGQKSSRTADTYTPNQPIALICLAEGAQSSNRETVGGELPPVTTNESWQQGNYVGPPSNIGGFNAVDVRPDTIIVTQHIEQAGQSLANISVFHPTDQVPSSETVVHRLHQAQAHINAADARITIDESQRIYDSGQIDIQLRMARNPMQSNVVQIGDTAFSGSPAGGYGASVAASQFSMLVSDVIRHPKFHSPEPADRQLVEDFYRKGVAELRDVRTGRPSEALRQWGVYSPETFEANIRQGAAARFEGLARITVPPITPQDRR